MDLGGKLGFPGDVLMIMPRVGEFGYLAEGRLNVMPTITPTSSPVALRGKPVETRVFPD